MRIEFQTDLKRNKTDYIKRKQKKFGEEPVARQYLILAHQIENILKEQPKKTLKDIAIWIGYSPARISQLMNLLYLAPFIQEEILLSKESYFNKITVSAIYKISQEIMWEKQKELWLQARDKER